ncbi:IS3 family transposase [Streptomyces sp. NBC_01589]|uniref:IS3 family transposase n=1 Tax=unclassified Streptomyces TaxID=2593676 RepID=UPI0038631CFF
MKRLCTILGIARSSFYYWRATAAERVVRQAADARLASRIRAVHHESDGTYGVPRVTAELQAVAATLNNRPRKTLGWKTPAEALNEHLLSLQETGVATTG